MPAQALRCRSCAAEYPLEDIGTCTDCFGPLDPVYDWEELARTVTRETISAGPSSIWRYAPLLPVDAPEGARLAPGLTPLVAAPRLEEVRPVEKRSVIAQMPRTTNDGMLGRYG